MAETPFKRALRMAQARAPQRKAEQVRLADERHRRIEAAGPEGAQRMISELEQSPQAEFIGPEKTPKEWEVAVRVAREAAIDAALHRRTITYGELKLAVYDATKKLVGYSMFPNLAMSVNRKSDGVLLSAIIVRKDTGEPGDGFAGYARDQGFDAPLEALQRQVFDHFGEDRISR